MCRAQVKHLASLFNRRIVASTVFHARLSKIITKAHHCRQYPSIPSTAILHISTMYALEDVEGQILLGLRQGAVLLYWHHGQNLFDYLTIDDQEPYHRELKSIRNQLRRGSVTTVKGGALITMNGIKLFTMEVTFQNQTCYPYMLVQKRGLFEDADCTPYFFTSEKSRDNAVQYINKL